MIVRIEIRIDLHTILVYRWFLGLDVVEEGRCLTVTGLIAEGAMRYICLFRRVVHLRGRWKLLIDSWLRSLTAQKVAIAAALFLELLVVLILPQGPATIGRRLIH